MILAVAVFLLFFVTISLLLAPLEALAWWAGWFDEQATEEGQESSAQGQDQADLYVVFLDGIAKAGHVNYDDVSGFLTRLEGALPGAVVLGDVFPYSPSRLQLTEGRPLSRFWRRMLQLKLQDRQPLLTFSINARNLLQVLVASDRRYAALYGRAAADAIMDALRGRGYSPLGGAPVVLVGYSGGAQVSLVATPFLKSRVTGEISLVSLGGVMADEPGLLQVEALLHVESRRDKIPKVGRLAFPALWSVWPRSRFARLRRSGRLTVVDPGPMRHNGRESYVDDETDLGGRSHQAVTADIVAGFLRERAVSAARLMEAT